MDGFCIFLGYSVQHTFISFFLWMSAMAMNMTYKFSDIFKVLTVLTMLTKFVLLDYSFAGDDHFVAIDRYGHYMTYLLMIKLLILMILFSRKSPRNIRRPWLP